MSLASNQRVLLDPENYHCITKKIKYIRTGFMRVNPMFAIKCLHVHH